MNKLILTLLLALSSTVAQASQLTARGELIPADFNRRLGSHLCENTASLARLEAVCKQDVIGKYADMNSLQMALHVCTQYSEYPGNSACFAIAAQKLQLPAESREHCQQFELNKEIASCYRSLFFQENARAQSSARNAIQSKGSPAVMGLR